MKSASKIFADSIDSGDGSFFEDGDSSEIFYDVSAILERSVSSAKKWSCAQILLDETLTEAL